MGIYLRIMKVMGNNTTLLRPDTIPVIKAAIKTKMTFTVKLGDYQLRGGMETYQGDFTPHIDDYDPLDPTEPTGEGYALFLSGQNDCSPVVDELKYALGLTDWQCSPSILSGTDCGYYWQHANPSTWVFWQEVTA